MIYGYKRPVVGDEKMEKQLVKVHIDRFFIEKHPFAKKRHQLDDLLMQLQPGDQLVVQNLVVLADSLHQLVDALRIADKDNVEMIFLEENLTSRTIPTMSFSQLAIFFADLQSRCLRHSTTFGLQGAKQQGKTIGRPKKSNDSLEQAFQMYESKRYTLKDIKEKTGISKSTLYRYIDTMNQ